MRMLVQAGANHAEAGRIPGRCGSGPSDVIERTGL